MKVRSITNVIERRARSVPAFLALAALALTFLTLGAVPARAAISIVSVTGVPNPVPADGSFSPILVTCAGTNGKIPTGTATLTNAVTGTTASTNPLAFDLTNANGTVTVYAYVAFPVNHNLTQSVTYTLTLRVHGSDGSSASRTMTQVQGILVPITLNSITPSASVLQPTDTSVGVSVDLTADGLNQAGYQSGYAQIADSSGTILDLQAFQGAPVSDGEGGLIYSPPPLTNVPVNTSDTPQTYTITAGAKDSTGAWAYASQDVTQLAAVAAVATTLTLDSRAKEGPYNIAVTLRDIAGNPLSGKPVSFYLNGKYFGGGTTNSRGRTSHKFTASPGVYDALVVFAGDATAAPTTAEANVTEN